MTEEDKLNVKEDETDVVDFIASHVLQFWRKDDKTI